MGGFLGFLLIVFLKGQNDLKLLLGGFLAISFFFIPLTNQRIAHLTPGIGVGPS